LEIQDLIKKRILDRTESEKRAKEPLGFFHPSSLGKCRRQIFLTKLSAKELPEFVLGAMMSGTILHHWIQSFSELKDNFLIEHPVKFPLSEEIYVTGSADIVDKKTGYVLDIKSIKSLAFVYKEPMAEHVEQLNSYLIGMGSKKGELLYIQKSDLATVSHVIDVNFELYQSTRKKVLDVYEQLLLWDAKKIKYCPFNKCECYYCKNEKLKPEFKDIDDGRNHLNTKGGAVVG
jgi:hypothetical protein